LATKLNLLLKEIESSEHVLNLRLENIQKNTFLANAFFHMVIALSTKPYTLNTTFLTNAFFHFFSHGDSYAFLLFMEGSPVVVSRCGLISKIQDPNPQT
jgi:hypothetical protein